MSIYTENVPYDNTTAANYKAWARVIGRAMTSFGWVKQSGHGELVDNGLSGASYDWNFTPTIPTTQLRASASYNFRGAWAGGTSYTGNNTLNGAAPDVVTNGGITYQCISATQYVITQIAMSGTTATITGTFANGGSNALAGLSIVLAGFVNSGNNVTATITASTTTTLTATIATGVNETHAATGTLNTAPASDTLHFQPYNYEIWKSNGSNTAALPIYVRLVYTSSSTVSIPAIHLSIGTGIDASGNTTNSWAMYSVAPTANKEINFSIGATGSSLFECDFSGDTDNFRMFMWRNHSSQQPASTVLVLDRAKNALGQDADAFVYAAHCGWNTSTAASVATSCVFLKPGLGTTFNVTTNQWSGAIATGPSGANWGSVCPLPVTPLVGFAANPCLGVVTFPVNDVIDGQVIPVWLYGASHNFLVNKNMSIANAASDPSGIVTRSVVAIRWE
jgi:hypothetical protein